MEALGTLADEVAAPTDELAEKAKGNDALQVTLDAQRIREEELTKLAQLEMKWDKRVKKYRMLKETAMGHELENWLDDEFPPPEMSGFEKDSPEQKKIDADREELKKRLADKQAEEMKNKFEKFESERKAFVLKRQSSFDQMIKEDVDFEHYGKLYDGKDAVLRHVDDTEGAPSSAQHQKNLALAQRRRGFARLNPDFEQMVAAAKEKLELDKDLRPGVRKPSEEQLEQWHWDYYVPRFDLIRVRLKRKGVDLYKYGTTSEWNKQWRKNKQTIIDAMIKERVQPDTMRICPPTRHQFRDEGPVVTFPEMGLPSPFARKVAGFTFTKEEAARFIQKHWRLWQNYTKIKMYIQQKSSDRGARDRKQALVKYETKVALTPEMRRFLANSYPNLGKMPFKWKDWEPDYPKLRTFLRMADIHIVRDAEFDRVV